MKVLLTPGIFPPDSGGPATFAPTLGRSLSNRGHAVRVVTNGKAQPKFDERYPFTVVRIPRGSNVVLRYSRQFSTLVSQIRSFEPNVVLSNAFDLQAVSAARVTDTPVATKVVGDVAWERARRAGIDDDLETFQARSYGPMVRTWKILRSLQTRGADRVIVPSEYLRDVVTAWGVPADRTKVIYNALEVDAPAVDLTDRADRIVTVGRLVPWKGVEGLVDAVGVLDDDSPELHVVGDGPRHDALERRAEHRGIAERVVFHGRVAHGRVLEIVANSRIFALNSTYEGLPHVVLEAMACGTPVVASAAGGTPEAVTDGESGLLVEQGDTAGFADAFDRLLSDDDLWIRLREGAMDDLKARFDHQGMVESYEQTLQQMARGK